MSAVHYRETGEPYTYSAHTVQHMQTCEEVPKKVVMVRKSGRVAILSEETWLVLMGNDPANFAYTMAQVYRERYK